MELFGYDVSEAAYLDRVFKEPIPARMAKPLALVTMKPTDVAELRRLSAFLSAAADRIEAEGAGSFALHYRGWSDEWQEGTADLAVVGLPDDRHFTRVRRPPE
jgi:hypothetical protein